MYPYATQFYKGYEKELEQTKTKSNWFSNIIKFLKYAFRNSF